MRKGLLVFALIGAAILVSWTRARLYAWDAGRTVVASTVSDGKTVKRDFDTEIKPIFQTRCQPCHFQGGSMYEQLPFDRAETIRKLGTKVFTRIHDKKERQLIREFLEQP